MKKNFTIAMLLLFSIVAFSQQNHRYGDMKFPAEGEGHPKITENTKIVYVDKEQYSGGFNLIMSHTDFSDGVAWYEDPATKKWGLIDTLGNVLKTPYLIPETLEPLPKFANGKAFVRAPQGETGYHVINKKGEVIKKLPNISKIDKYNLEDGYAGVLYYGDYYSGYKYGFIDLEGKEIFAATSAKGKYVDTPTPYHFCNELAPYHNQITNKWGYFNKEGKIIIEAKYDKAEIFSDSLAAVCIENKWGFIDSKGNVVIDCKYSIKPANFNHGKAIIYSTTGVKKWIIDKSGTQLAELNEVSPFNHNGLAVAEVTKKGTNSTFMAVINSDLKILASLGAMGWRDSNFTIIDYDDFFVVGRNYVTDRDLNVIFQVYSIDAFCDGLAFVLFDAPKQDRQSAYVNTRGEIVILFKYNEF